MLDQIILTKIKIGMIILNEYIKSAVENWVETQFEEIELIHMDNDKFVLSLLDDRKIAVYFEDIFLTEVSIHRPGEYST